MTHLQQAQWRRERETCDCMAEGDMASCAMSMHVSNCWYASACDQIAQPARGNAGSVLAQDHVTPRRGALAHCQMGADDTRHVGVWHGDSVVQRWRELARLLRVRLDAGWLRC